jgi:hypothetical protein
MRGTKRGKMRLRSDKRARESLEDTKAQAALFKHNKNVPLYYKIASEMCVAGCKVLGLLEKRTASQKTREYAARVLYLLPYIIFKFRKTGI